jgi:oxaloacetate decarboxylase alpha subunit
MNLETIEQIVTLITEHPVSEITVEQGDERIYVRRSTGVPAAQISADAELPAGAEIEEARPISSIEILSTPAEEPLFLTAPMVGLFHHLASPLPYGALVAAGQAIGSIESMKLMNDVLADQGGRVVEVLAEDGAPVEYGQPLFRLAAG